MVTSLLPESEYEFDTEKNPATNFVKRISERGENNIYSGLNNGEKNLVTAFPTVALEWDYSRNAKGPAEFPPYSNKRVFWICNAGHQWEEKINNRTRNGLPCPYCGGSRPIPGVNDLGTLYPWLEKQWDYERNGDLKPSNVFHKSNRRVSWICEKGHKWEAKIYHRTEGRGCPFCAGIRPILGETDLETLEPVISKQWHPEKNGEHLPSNFTRFSHYKAVWKCDKGHEYTAPIYRRSRGSGCPVCEGKKLVPGENDLRTRAPRLAQEWNHKGNAGIIPDQVALHSNTKYSWCCSKCGHVWKASPNNRAAGEGCPRCAGNCVDPEVNSFAAVNPELLQQWDVEQNKPLTAWDVAAYDNRNYYWICNNKHSFLASPANRTKGTRCPYCVGKLPVFGENDLRTICPSVAKEWHPTKNEKNSPEHYLPNSHAEVWWKCSNGHEWLQKIYERANGSRCPYCQERKPIVDHNDLITQYPDVAKYWHDSLKKKGPELYFSSRTTSVWWKCENGHSFRAPIRDMVLRWRCPRCERSRMRRKNQ